MAFTAVSDSIKTDANDRVKAVWLTASGSVRQRMMQTRESEVMISQPSPIISEIIITAYIRRARLHETESEIVTE